MHRNPNENQHSAGALLVAAAALALVASCDSNAAASTAGGAAQAPQAPVVTVAPVELRDLAEFTEFTARVEPIENVEIRPRVSGHVATVAFKTGQMVHKGDVLYTIDPRWQEAAVAGAEAAVGEARVRVENAERESKRAEQLSESRTISTEDAEGRTSRLALARAALLVAEAGRDSAQLDLDFTQVRSPVDGRVGRPLVTTGNFVSGAPGFSTLLTTVVSVDPVYVDADVDEESLMRLKRAMEKGELPLDEQGRVHVAIGRSDDQTFPNDGWIESFENRLDPNTGSILMRAIAPNPALELVPGMFVRVRVPTTTSQPTLLVSERAIGTDQSQKFVLVLTPENTVAYRGVKLGPLVEGKRVIREGLAADEKVVVNGLQRVRPGAPVTPELEATAVSAR